MVETDIEVRWIIQREMHLQDETQALKSTLDNYGNGEDGVDILKPQQLIAYERELSLHGSQKWLHIMEFRLANSQTSTDKPISSQH